MDHSLLHTLKKTLLIKPHPAGMPFIGGGILAALFLSLISGGLGFIAILFTAFSLYFFRDPDRVTPQKSSLVLATGDGVVSAIVNGVSLPPEIAVESGGKFTRISIFLSVLDVHVNRIPVSGKIVRKVYTPGKFLNADLDKASVDNERCAAVIETEDGKEIGVVQIAGMVARRIVNELGEGDAVRAGARFGIIRFGSRMDTYIPEGVAPLVCVGQRAVGGETILADLDETGLARKGAIV